MGTIMSKRLRSVMNGPPSCDKGRVESVKKKPKLEPVKCPICLEEFDGPQMDEQLRILPCTDCICHTCLVQLIGTKGDMSTITCPRCQQPQPLFVDPYERTTPTVLAELFPTRTKYSQALKRNESSLLEQKETINNPCSICREEATDNCLTCGLQCTRHSESAHAKWPNHLHQSIQAAAERKKEEEQEEVHKILSPRSHVVDELNGIRAKWSDASLTCIERKKEIEDSLNRAEYEMATMKELVTQLLVWLNQLKSRQRVLTTFSDEIGKQRTKLLNMQQSKVEIINNLQKLSLAELTEKMKVLDQLFNIDQIRESEKQLEQVWNDRPTLGAPHPAIEFTRGLTKSAILSTLAPATLARLNEFLQRSTSRTMFYSPEMNRMIYKASWDGWFKEDFLKCCVGKSSLVILVKVEGNEYVFGAYIEPVWPADGEVLPDLSKRSFIFSLTNRCDHPIRLSLTNPKSAVDLLDCEVAFGQVVKDASGKAVKWHNLMLFYGGRPANDPSGICINDQNDSNYVYQLEYGSKKSAPPQFVLNSKTIGGGELVGASEIEVYQL